VETLRVVANEHLGSSPEPQVTATATLRHLTKLRKQAEGVMRVVQDGHLQGRALQEALSTYQRIWVQIEEFEQQPRIEQPESAVTEIRYDRAVVEDFVAKLPEALRSDVRLGREFLRDTLQYIRVGQGDRRQRTCPVCGCPLGKITPQHLAGMASRSRRAIRDSQNWALQEALGW
jgi:hypothetical protein